MADAKLNLADCPILEFPDKGRLLIVPPGPGKQDLPTMDLSAIRSYWPGLSILPVGLASSVEHILDAVVKARPNRSSGRDTVHFLDHGAQVSVNARWWLDEPEAGQTSSPERGASRIRTAVIPSFGPNAAIPISLVNYLAQHSIFLKAIDGSQPEGANPPGPSSLQEIPAAQPKAFVAALAAAMGLSYSTGVSISFPYCGMQIPAVTNLITTRAGRSILVDFGSFYGDTITAIEHSGLRVVSIRSGEPCRSIIEKLLTAAGLSYQTDPSFSVPSTRAAYGVHFCIPGFLVNRASSRGQLLSLAPLAPAVVQWFTSRGLDIVQIATQGMHS
jgi:hypothetical protein